MALLATPVAIDDPSLLDDALARAGRARDQGADLIEWRVDMLVGEDASLGTVCTLVKDSPLPCILTCRTAEEGGGFDGPEFERIALLERLLDEGLTPRYLDLEHARLRADDALRQVACRLREQGTSLICSAHDFTKRPPDLLRLVAAMGEDPDCDVIKIAFQPAALRETLECAELLAARPKPMIALAMGQIGLLSRVMAGAWGGLLTFAALDGGSGTAPGQPTLGHLREQWRVARCNDQTTVYGLIGWPLGASPGYAWHNDAFAKADRNAVYLPLPVREGWERFKADVLELLGHPLVRFGGASVTMPHKGHCLQLVRDAGGSVDPLADAAGAANTLRVDADGALQAANTDGTGAIEVLARQRALHGARAAVLGAGGAARAIVVGLLQAGATVSLFNRTLERAEALAADLASVGPVQVGGDGPFDLAVQCTSVGMAHGDTPDGDACAATGFDADALAADAVVLETIYAPEETAFTRACVQCGATVVGGRAMWTAQAGAQQRWFTPASC